MDDFPPALTGILGRIAIVVSLLAGLAIVAGIYMMLAGRSTSPTPSPQSTNSFGNFEISQITSSGNAETPAISPDGKYVVYAQRERGAVPRSMLPQEDELPPAPPRAEPEPPVAPKPTPPNRGLLARLLGR